MGHGGEEGLHHGDTDFGEASYQRADDVGRVVPAWVRTRGRTTVFEEAIPTISPEQAAFWHLLCWGKPTVWFNLCLTMGLVRKTHFRCGQIKFLREASQSCPRVSR